jgi:hypothetical protein
MDSVIESRTSKQYMAIVACVLVFFSFVDMGLMNIIFRHGEEPVDMHTYYFISLPVVWLLVIGIGILRKPQKVSISDYGILFYGNIFNGQQRVMWEDIKSIAVSKRNQSVRSLANYNQLMQIELKNGDEYYISDGEYENYDEMRDAIYNVLHPRHGSDAL